MVNDIIVEVAGAINAAFGDRYSIYQNDVKQGLLEPCFFVAVLGVTRTPEPNGRYAQAVPLDIAYFPETDGDNQELQAVANTLFDVLEFIETADGGLRHGVNMVADVVDGVLHFSVEYQLSLCRPREETTMETLQTEVGTGGGA